MPVQLITKKQLADNKETRMDPARTGGVVKISLTR